MSQNPVRERQSDCNIVYDDAQPPQRAQWYRANTLSPRALRFFPADAESSRSNLNCWRCGGGFPQFPVSQFRDNPGTGLVPLPSRPVRPAFRLKTDVEPSFRHFAILRCFRLSPLLFLPPRVSRYGSRRLTVLEQTYSA